MEKIINKTFKNPLQIFLNMLYYKYRLKFIVIPSVWFTYRCYNIYYKRKGNLVEIS